MSIDTTAPSGVVHTNPLKALGDFGQSVWLDYIRRSLIDSGELQRLVDQDGVSGVTSNPSIFEKAIAASDDYTATLEQLAASGTLDAKSLFEALAIEDIQAAADVLHPVYRRTRYRDGYVSLEVSPHLAHDAAATIDEARRLWYRLARPNVMIKVPATDAGVQAVEELVADGINVNVTLLFSIEAYERIAHAYVAGAERFARRGGDPERVASVASFFVSRIDTAIDAALSAGSERLTAAERAERASLRGRVAIANARLAYESYGRIFSSDRWRVLSLKGARTQRLLWASTSTKNPDYRDVVYVEELIGAETVNTIPPDTLDAFRRHGEPRWSLTHDIEGARKTMDALARTRVSMRDVTAALLDDGLRLFVRAFDTLLAAIDRKRARLEAAAREAAGR